LALTLTSATAMLEPTLDSKKMMQDIQKSKPCGEIHRVSFLKDARCAGSQPLAQGLFWIQA
jgi:hypothetical protein